MTNNAAGFPLLSCIIFLPAIAGLLLMLAPRAQAALLRMATIGVSLLTLLLTLFAAWLFNPANPSPQLEEWFSWIPSLGIGYHLGVDGINVWLVVLTAFLAAVAIVASWHTLSRGTKEATTLLLLLEAGILGALTSFDLILFFVFWEAMLIPMYLIIGVVGSEGRMSAALKFFLYTTAGSLTMLLAIIGVSFAHASQTGQTTFDLTLLSQPGLPAAVQGGLFLAFALAFAIKVPLVPLHTWLPDTYARTPLATLVLGTMLVKVGAYGFLRFCFTLFPAAATQFAPLISTLAVISILYGWFAAYGQRDIVRLIAYTSIAHMGFVVLGAFAFNNQGIQGSILQMVNHGISTGAMFLLAAALIRRTGTRDITQMGGLGGRYPILYGVFLVALFSTIGLPGLNGFVGEFMVLLGAYRATPAFALVALLSVVLAAVVLLWLFRVTMQGPFDQSGGDDRDLTTPELTALAPLVVLIIALGLLPNILLAPMQGAVDRLVTGVQASQTQAAEPLAERPSALSLVRRADQ